MWHFQSCSLPRLQEMADRTCSSVRCSDSVCISMVMPGIDSMPTVMAPDPGYSSEEQEQKPRTT